MAGQVYTDPISRNRCRSRNGTLCQHISDQVFLEQCTAAHRRTAHNALIGRINTQRKEFKPALFAEKVQHLKDKVLPKYDIEQRCLTLEDM